VQVLGCLLVPALSQIDDAEVGEAVDFIGLVAGRLVQYL
jgi:hypothetical protein